VTAEGADAERPPIAREPRFGHCGYVEYVPGDLPIILSVPHDGGLAPAEIPDRTAGVTSRDAYTGPLARATADALCARTGLRPHLVLCHLSRRKLDANRPLAKAAAPGGIGRAARAAWHEYHAFIEAAKSAVTARHGQGLYVDVHAHAHPEQRVELGYLLRGRELALPDGELSQPAYVGQSSIRSLAAAAPERFAEMVRGPHSLGGLLEARGIPAVPSPSRPSPDDVLYFNGGYNTAAHGSRDGGSISGVQIEANRVGLRDSEAARERFGRALAETLVEFVGRWVGVTLPRAGRVAGAAAGAGRDPGAP